MSLAGEWVIYVTAFVVGAVLGSFVNVVIYRGPVLWGLVDAPARGDLAAPGSYCPHCRRPLRFFHLLPVFSFIFLGGKCAACRTPISRRYPAVELLGAAAAALAIALFGLTAAGAAAFGVFLCLIALGFIDAETGYLPDILTLPLIGAGLAAAAFGLITPLFDAMIGAGVGYGAFRLIDLAFLKLRGREGLGQGDAKLLAAIGAWLGWAALPGVVFLASILTLLILLALRLPAGGLKGETPVAFGPGLAAAGALGLIAKGLGLPFFA